MVELIVYESDPPSDAGSGPDDQGSEEMVRLNQMKLGQDCQRLDGDPAGTDTTTNPLVSATSTFDASRPITIPSSPSPQPIFLGSTDQDSCHSGMVLMINTLAADVAGDGLSFADGIKADGSTIADVLRAWESIVSPLIRSEHHLISLLRRTMCLLCTRDRALTMRKL